MEMRVAFLSTGHEIFDDRIFYHMSKTLIKNKMQVMISCSNEEYHDSVQGVLIHSFSGNQYSKKEKMNAFYARLSDFSPDVIICSEPLPIMASYQYKRTKSPSAKIIYDITEWYPSKKNLEKIPLVFKWVRFLQFILFHLFTVFFCDGFIFGEWYKSRPFRILFARKPYVFISYYPHLSIIPVSLPKLHHNSLKLSYSGKLSVEKGFGNFISVLERLNHTNPQLKIELKIIGWYTEESEKNEFESRLAKLKNTSLSFYPKLPLHDYLNTIKDIDVFLDLRDDDVENQHCLPIKLFYYAALGRPVIFTDLKSVRKEVEVGLFGYLTNPADSENISLLINKYLMNPELYYDHCANARKLSEEKYNWALLEDDFVRFLLKVFKQGYAE